MIGTEGLRKLEPSAFCVGTLERCAEPGAGFWPLTEPDLVRAAATQGVSSSGPFTLAFSRVEEGTLALEGESNVHRVPLAGGGDREADSSLLVLDGRQLALATDGSLHMEVSLGADRSCWATPAWVGPAEEVQAHAAAMLGVPIFVMGWLALSGVQQLVAPRRSAQTIGAYATAAVNLAALARVASMQVAWTGWWSAWPGVRRGIELLSMPILAVAGLVFYRWLAGASLHTRAMLAFYAAAALSGGALVLAHAVPPLRGGAIASAQVVLVVAALGCAGSVIGAWRTLRADERSLLAVGVAGVVSCTLVDVITSRAGRPLIFGAGIGPLGLCFETLCQALILSRRDARAHAEVSRLATAAKEASERELAEQARVNVELTRLDALKEAFVANTSHELRTPLNGVIGLAESLLASQEELGPRTAQGLRTILTSGKRLDRLVSDLLDFSRAKDGALQVELVAVDLASVVSETLLLLAPLVGSKDLRLTSDVPPALPLARADETRVSQALQHVLSNAIKFAERGEVRCDATRVDQRLVLAVEDTGPGFSAETLERGVVAFEQGDGSSTRTHGGTGMGLAFAKRLMELQGGTLRISNRPGGGARVEIELLVAPPAQQRSVRARTNPVVSIPPPARRSTPPIALRNVPHVSIAPRSAPARESEALFAAARRVAQRTGAKPRVLVADDERVNLERIELDLEDTGFEIVMVEDGAAAVRAFDEQGPFDLVLLDVMMPKLDGLGACRAIRERSTMQEVPVVMVTAKREPKDLEAGFQAGANDYLTKPYVRQELLQRVQAHASIARTTRAMARFVPQPLATLLGRKHLTEIELGDCVEKELSIVFLDIRGFTTVSERMTSRQVFAWLNDQFAAIVPAFHAHGGVVDKFLGDAVMAIFPRGPGAALQAVVAASEALGRSPNAASVGFGVHHGSTMLGAIGELSRLAPTVVSDTVNVASRLEALTRRLGAVALVSDEALSAAGLPQPASRFLGAFRLKGRAKAIRVHELVTILPKDLQEERIAAGRVIQTVVAHLERGAYAAALEEVERGVATFPEDGALGLYHVAVEGFCSGGSVYDGAIELGEK